MSSYSNRLPILFNQSTGAWDFGLTNVTASGIAGAEATALWAGTLAIQGGTSSTSAVNGGNLKINGGGATGGGGAVIGQLLIGTDALLTSAITIGTASVGPTIPGKVVLAAGSVASVGTGVLTSGNVCPGTTALSIKKWMAIKDDAGVNGWLAIYQA